MIWKQQQRNTQQNRVHVFWDTSYLGEEAVYLQVRRTHKVYLIKYAVSPKICKQFCPELSGE